MEDRLIINRETLTIEGGRNLYNYTFHAAGIADQLVEMIEVGQIGVIGPFLALHPDLDLSTALALAKQLGNEEAIKEIEAHH